MNASALPKKKILCLIGTRPETIKVAPVVIELKKNPNFDVKLVSSGQHRELVQGILKTFKLELDGDCSVMAPNQTLESLTAKLFTALADVFRKETPDLVLAQGDTTTVLVASMVCFYQKIPFAHLEAGLRSHDLQSPFPEEMNRRVSSLISTLHFAPTEEAKGNLIREATRESDVTVTGNTVIDALLYVRSLKPEAPVKVAPGNISLLLTAHRRENFGEPHRRVFAAIQRLIEKFPKIEVIYPVHPNPNVMGAAQAAFKDVPRIHLVPPMDYEALVATMDQAKFILTDSGGIQEEAPALGKPVVILREETERPEVVSAGAGILCGTDEEKIFEVCSKLLNEKEYFDRHVIGYSPVGDGHASERVSKAIQDFFSGSR